LYESIKKSKIGNLIYIKFDIAEIFYKKNYSFCFIFDGAAVYQI